MQEQRIFPSEVKKYTSRALILTAILIAALLIQTWLWDVLSLGYIFAWIIAAEFLMMLVILLYHIAWLRKSLARPVVPERIHYDARALEPRTPIVIVLFAFMSVLSLTGPFLSLIEGNYEHLYLLVTGLIWPTAIALVLIRAFRLRFSIEENGLVLNDSAIPSMPAKFIPFEELVYLNVEGRALVYRGRAKSIRGRLIIKDPAKLRSVLKEVYHG